MNSNRIELSALINDSGSMVVLLSVTLQTKTSHHWKPFRAGRRLSYMRVHFKNFARFRLPDSGCCRIVQSIAGYPVLPDIRYIPILNTSPYKCFAYLPPFGPKLNVKLCSPNFTPVWGLGWTEGLKMAPIEMSFSNSYLTSIYTIGLSYTVWSQYTT